MDDSIGREVARNIFMQKCYQITSYSVNTNKGVDNLKYNPLES